MTKKIETLIEAEDALKKLANGFNAWIDATQHLAMPPVAFVISGPQSPHLGLSGKRQEIIAMLATAIGMVAEGPADGLPDFAVNPHRVNPDDLGIRS